MTRREAIANAATLAGIGLSIPLLSLSLSSCKSDSASQLDVLSQDQASALKTLGNIILPKGNNLGAADVNLTGLTDILLRDCEEPKAKDQMLTTLSYLNAQGINNPGFEEKLRSIEDQAFNSGNPSADIAGYRKLKSYILFAFFTSENVMESMLDYNTVPTKYDGCVPVTADTKIYVDLNV